MTWYDQLHHIGPAVVLLAGAGLVLTADLALSGRARPRTLALLTLAAAAGYALWHVLAGTAGEAMGGAVVVDDFGMYFAFLLITVTAAVVVVTRESMGGVRQEGEFFALLLTSTGAMVLLAQAQDLITIFVAIETTSIAQFILVGLARDDRSSEAGLKYLLSGAVAAAVLLYGFAFLFGLTGATDLGGINAAFEAGGDDTRVALLFAFVLVAAGLGFKMAIVPFHGWVPDVYQGAPTPVTSFLSVASKAVGFAVVLRIFYQGLGGPGTTIAHDWAVMFAVLAGLSMTFGNLGAMLQSNVKRLLAYSSIAQAGNIAVGLAAVAAGSTVGPSAVLFFLGTYVATNLGAFFCVTVVSRRVGSEEMSAYAGLYRRSPVVAVILGLCLLSLTGIPPTAGFLAKVYVFNSAIQTGEQWLVWLVVVAVLNTAVSAYYYMRWARTMVLDEPEDATSFRPVPAVRALLVLTAVAVVFFGLVPTPLIDAARRAAEALA